MKSISSTGDSASKEEDINNYSADMGQSKTHTGGGKFEEVMLKSKIRDKTNVTNVSPIPSLLIISKILETCYGDSRIHFRFKNVYLTAARFEITFATWDLC